MRRAVCTVFVLILLFSSRLAAQTIVLEAAAGVESLVACNWVHLANCEERHIIGELPPTVGGVLELDGERFIVEWMGPGYHFESGLILQPWGAAKRGLRGQRWLEVYPVQGRIHTSQAWKDVDGNRALSRSDTLRFRTGFPLGVMDVRLQLRVRPAPPEP
jgi:hypothetical protein